MHFLFTAPRYHTNQHFAMKALLDAGHQVSFLALTRGHSEEYESLTPTILGHSSVFGAAHRLFTWPKGSSLGTNAGIPPILKFWSEVRRRRPTVVVVRNPNSAFGLLSVLAAKAVRAQLIFYTQTRKYRRLSLWRKAVRSFALWATGADWITPVLGSPETAGPAHSRLHYVPFVSRPTTSPQEKIWFRGGTINIIAIGKFQGRKNHGMLLDAVSRLTASFRIHLTLIGECTTEEHQQELESIRYRVEALRLGDKVDIRVNLSFADVQNEYPRHDLFVLASRDDPAAVSPLEAMANSLPVICSDSNGTECYIRRGENGFVFSTDDLDELTKCIKEAVIDRHRLMEMGALSYQLVVEEHSPQSYVNALASIATHRRAVVDD